MIRLQSPIRRLATLGMLSLWCAVAMAEHYTVPLLVPAGTSSEPQGVLRIVNGTDVGDARLVIETDLSIVPLAFVRAADGTLSAMHDKRRVPKRSNRAGQAVRLAASSARHNHSIIGACHRARLRRLDPPRAIKATAHQLARLIYAMLTRGEAYVEKGIEHFETERRDRQVRYLQRQARHFNLAPVEIEQVA